MIQRPQSLFFLGVLICQSLLFFVNLVVIANDKAVFEFTLNGLLQLKQGGQHAPENTSGILLVIGNSLICLYTIWVIFQFKNRRQQIKLAGLNMVLLTALAAGLVYRFETVKEIAFTMLGGNVEQIRVTYGLGMILPVLSLVCNALALRGIRKDEELVRSADRIR